MERSRGFGSMNTGGSGEKAKRPEEIIDCVQIGKDFVQMRLVGPVYGYAQYWIDIVTQKGVISIPKVVPNYDSETDTFDSTIKDPYADIPNPKRQAKVYYSNAIIRDFQDDYKHKKEKEKFSKDEKKSGIKDPKSKSKTPCRGVKISGGVAQDLKRLITMNKHKVDGKVKECELSDPKYGRDIFISYDAKAAGAKKYSTQLGDHTPLTKEEEEYLLWDVSGLMVAESVEEAKKEAEALSSKAPADEDVSEDDDDDVLSKKKKKKGGKDKSSKSDKKSDKGSSKDKDKKSDKSDKGSKDKSSKDDAKKSKDKGGKSDKESKSSSKDKDKGSSKDKKKSKK